MKYDLCEYLYVADKEDIERILNWALNTATMLRNDDVVQMSKAEKKTLEKLHAAIYHLRRDN